MKKRWISLVLAFAMIVTLVPHVTLDAKAAASGICGENLTWVLNDYGTLTISGTGAMADYAYAAKIPWYSIRSSVKRVMIEDGVTSIGNSAFYTCDSMTNVTIPASVTSIGDEAFARCYGLTSITIPDGVISIGRDTFYSCYNLTSITIPDSVNFISDGAFLGCIGLTRVTIPHSVTTVGERAFSNCSSLTGIFVDESNPNYSSDDFGCLFDKDKTTLIQAPGGLSEAYVIPAGVSIIGDDAFCGCHNLVSVTIPDSVATIGVSAFTYCRNLVSVTIPASVTSIRDQAFYGCTRLTGFYVDEYNGYYSNDDSGCLFDKRKRVLIQAPGALAGYYDIPDTVTTIGELAFSDCDLVGVTIPESVTSIKRWAFLNCDDLVTVSIPSSVTSIDVYAFQNCTSLISILIPDSITIIRAGLFNSCTDLAFVSISDSVTTISNNAFEGCTSLNSITIPNSVTSISNRAFSNCTSLNSITIPNSVTSISDGAFSNCTSLSNVYYSGTEEEWNAIAIGSNNEDLTNAALHCSSDDYRLQIHTMDNSFSVYANRTIYLEVSLLSDEGYEFDWNAPSVAMSQSGICDYEILPNGHRYRIVITGRQPGHTTMTITSPYSTASISIPITILPDSGSVHTYRVNTVPSFHPDYIHDSHLLTNFYNLKGIYINSYTCSENEDGSYHVSFDAYNRSFCHGAVDVYDENGQWKTAHRIERYADVASLADSGEFLLDLFDAATSFQLLAYTNQSICTYTPISFDVPANGYFTISSNSSLSKGTYLFNVMDLVVLAAKLLTDGSNLSGDTSKTLATEIANEAAESELLSKAIEKEMGNLIVRLSEMVTTPDDIAKWSEILVDTFDKCISPFYNWRSRLETEANVLEGGFTLLGGPYGWALDTMFKSIDFRNYIMQFCQLSRNLDSVPICIYACESGRPATVTGVEVVGELPDESVVQVAPDSPNLDDILKCLDVSNVRSSSSFAYQYRQRAYNVQVFCGGVSYRPTSLIQITFPTNDQNGTLHAVMHQNEAGTWEAIGFSAQNDSVTVEKAQVGRFALIYREACLPFTDVPADSFYYDSVMWAVENGVTSGATATTFNPNGACLRAQVVTFLWRAEGCPKPESSVNPFVDVKASDFYYDAVLWAVEKGITNGADATHFNPMGVCNRAQVVTFLHRTFGAPAVEGDDNPFADVPTGGWYTAPVLWAVEQGSPTA